MTQKNYPCLHIQQVVAACALLIMALGAYAQDVRDDPDLTTPLGAGGISYDPPTEDVFVADSGPGLDTGCTFNDDPEHPLIIDIPIDRYVGEVDANGFLKKPDELIANGIIPATIDVGMPAYDVDVNGSPPPEHDEALFNGESLGLLTGDNNIWKLNAFQVDISKVKFPAKPSPNSPPTPVVNTVQINIDLLSTGRWCTSIDWVALYIPIKPKFALTLELKKGHNEISVSDPTSHAIIDTIYKQSFDAECNLTEEIGEAEREKYPFSGPTGSEVKIHTKIEPCPADTSSPPKVLAVWNILETSQHDTVTWLKDFEGDVTITMPNKIGVYYVYFDYFIDGFYDSPLLGKLLVTKNAVDVKHFPDNMPPRRSWYEKAMAFTIPGDEPAILKTLLNGIYSFGYAGNWRYGYCFGGSKDVYGDCREALNTCEWFQLLDFPNFCNYTDCQSFSRLFKNMAHILGFGKFEEVTIQGITDGYGFLTTKRPSLDSKFPGNAYPSKSPGKFDRYMFSDHILQQKGGLYYDAIFNTTYDDKEEPIAYWVIDISGRDSKDRVVLKTESEPFAADGPDVTNLGTYAYDSWQDFRYVFKKVKRGTRESANQGRDIRFTGNTTFRTLDKNGDGFAEGIFAEVEVEILTAGRYDFLSFLEKEGRPIVNTPSLERNHFISANLDEEPGIYTVFLRFSGEKIFRSGKDGPYEVLVLGTGLPNMRFRTPAYDHTQFGELEAILTGISETASDDNGDGQFDLIEMTVDVNVRTAGKYYLLGSLFLKDSSVLEGKKFTLTQGTHQLKLRLPGQAIRRAGLDGPYTGQVSLSKYNPQKTLDSTSLVTRPYHSSDFSVVLEPNGIFKEQGIDTNGNGLFDILRVEFGVDVAKAGTFLIKGELTNQAAQHFVYTEIVTTLAMGPQLLTLDFSGNNIHINKIEGPYQIEIRVQEPDTFENLDRTPLEEKTAAYSFTDFEPFPGGKPPRPISLTGKSFDKGVDTDGNGLFDELHVDVEVKLDNTDFYEWSARLVDVKGTEIGFDSRKATLNAGTATIQFVFDGKLIGRHGVNGPYFVKGLLMYGQQSKANLISFEVAETPAYQARKFEGFVDLSVELDSLVAVSDMEGIHLTWTTGIEKNHAGFRFWRVIKDSNGGYAVTQLKEKKRFYHAGCARGQLVTAFDSANPLIKAIGHSRKGACYSFTDTSITQDGTYYYVLEDIDTSGKRTFHCDAITAATRGKGLAINLEAVKGYCQQVTSSKN